MAKSAVNNFARAVVYNFSRYGCDNFAGVGVHNFCQQDMTSDYIKSTRILLYYGDMGTNL